MVKRTNFSEKVIAVALELTCKQANLPDLDLEYCVAVSNPSLLETIQCIQKNREGQLMLQPGFIQAKTLTKVICIERSIFCN